ncbi:MAG TPA: hypothetical protein PKJ04_05210 [Nitrospira sp.]|nr:hypothetical protein [Nitrospira sp.]MCW5779243.1 hypothetical protein [Nitrospira sp.]HNN42287.1 hypothetical protein [Nitrospira sp.]HUM39104.1 hypothetical protein [Nitrospira sp.]
MGSRWAGKIGSVIGRIRGMWSWTLSGALVLAWTVGVVDAGALEFTADQVTKINGRTQKSNIYYRDNMWRIEHHTMGPVNVSIVRKDKQVVWLLLSRMKHFKTVPYKADQDLKVTEHLEGEVSREEIGTETREGHPTTLYEVTVKEGERTEVYYQWLATDIHFPMKLAKKDGSWIVEYQHVKFRPLIEYLFQLPLNFEPLEEFDHQPAAAEPNHQPM